MRDMHGLRMLDKVVIGLGVWGHEKLLDGECKYVQNVLHTVSSV